LSATNPPAPPTFVVLDESLLATPSGWERPPAPDDGLRLHSHFQPIFSLSHRRPVGHEALLRASDAAGQSIPPLAVLDAARDDFARIAGLDRLCRALHFRNFAQQATSPPDDWLFLNMNAEVFLRGAETGEAEFLAEACRTLAIPPERLVIEILEDAVQDIERLQEAAAYFRRLGCLVALDDFGAGHSNFDRVWRLKPEIVKLDRSLIVSAATDGKLRRFLAQMVQLLHEAGAMVLLEGIETAHEAYIAMESDVDFVQGYYFGRPAPSRVDNTAGTATLDALWDDFDRRWRAEQHASQANIAPYRNAIGYASVLLSAGRSLEEACASFLTLPKADFCYVLDASGQQLGTNLHTPTHATADARFLPLADARGARWARRPYFRRALENFGKVQATRPYLSVASARLCVTLSVSFKVAGELRVICGDMLWEG
jgi:EAL domain-containing protein (putative c-di-GMP-specific phosphodiesterase class I)